MSKQKGNVKRQKTEGQKAAQHRRTTENKIRQLIKRKERAAYWASSAGRSRMQAKAERRAML